MFYLGYFCGSVTTFLVVGLSFTAFIFLFKDSGKILNGEFPSMALPKVFNRQKKTPKSITEEEEWRKEQKVAPRDPGY